MSCKELIESLRKAADEKVRALWEENEAEAVRLRSDVAARLDQLRQEQARNEQVMIGDQEAKARSEANRRSRVIGLSAELQLSERLYREAAAMLPSLRQQGYDKVFADLARELPALAWQMVCVNPEDENRARALFPAAEIIGDAAISGGMDVSARDGAIRVVNTFEKRLERAWGDLQPLLIRDAYREVEREGPSSAASRPGLSGGISADADQRQAIAADL